MNLVKLDINPQILRWAREEAGYEYDEAAKKVSVTPETYQKWESNGSRIPLGKLTTLANAYKRQIAVFLLPATPEKLKRPNDFRNLAPAKSKLSKSLLRVIRDVTYFRQISRELRDVDFWTSRYDWLEDIESEKLSDAPLVEYLRERLDVNIDDQLGWQSDSEAYRKWRNAVETRLGILVFQFPMPMDEAQGFSFTDSFPFAIVTNSRHSYTGRIFTIFHELGHILRRHSGICLPDRATENQKEEWACNNFSGRFLVPGNLVETVEDLKSIDRYSSRLNVSREVYLRRLRDEGKISDMRFFGLLDEIKATYKTASKKKGWVSPEVKSRATRGETFYNMVLDALHDNHISYSRASSVLDLGVPKLLREI